jgi:hypothetical protein
VGRVKGFVCDAASVLQHIHCSSIAAQVAKEDERQLWRKEEGLDSGQPEMKM